MNDQEQSENEEVVLANEGEDPANGGTTRLSDGEACASGEEQARGDGTAPAGMSSDDAPREDDPRAGAGEAGLVPEDLALAAMERAAPVLLLGAATGETGDVAGAVKEPVRLGSANCDRDGSTDAPDEGSMGAVPVVAELLPPEDGEGSAADDGGGAALINGLIERFKLHAVMSSAQHVVVALWIIYTYVHDLFLHSPFLAFLGGTKRCGKSTALTLVGAHVRDSLIVVNPTTASLMRDIDAYGTAVMIDELDLAGIHGDKELRALLNAAHNRQTATIPRVIKGEVRRFSVFAPKAMALIGSPPSTLRDRCIPIRMQRAKAGETVQPLTPARLAEYRNLTQRIAAWVNRHRAGIDARATSVQMPDGLNSRAQDNARPLLAVAEELGVGWAADATRAIIEVLADPEGPAQDPAEHLICCVQPYFSKLPPGDDVMVDALFQYLTGSPESSWTEVDETLTKAKMGRLLGQLGIRSKARRLGAGAGGGQLRRVYPREQVLDAIGRYCPRSSPIKDAPFDTTQGASPCSEGAPSRRATAAPDLAGATPVAAIVEPAPTGATKSRGRWLTAKGVRAIRRRLALTQAELATLVGVSARSVARWETSIGVLKLRAEARNAVFAARHMGVRTARKILSLAGSSRKVAGEKKAMGRKRRSTQKAGRDARRRKGHSQRTVRSAGQVRR